MDDALRIDVMTALSKHYKAKELAKLKSCPLCGYKIGENVWTIMDFKTGDGIGLAGVQCSNPGCLLHRGIVYEEEGERLKTWQAKQTENREAN